MTRKNKNKNKNLGLIRQFEINARQLTLILASITSLSMRDHWSRQADIMMNTNGD